MRRRLRPILLALGVAACSTAAVVPVDDAGSGAADADARDGSTTDPIDASSADADADGGGDGDGAACPIESTSTCYHFTPPDAGARPDATDEAGRYPADYCTSVCPTSYFECGNTDCGVVCERLSDVADATCGSPSVFHP